MVLVECAATLSHAVEVVEPLNAHRMAAEVTRLVQNCPRFSTAQNLNQDERARQRKGGAHTAHRVPFDTPWVAWTLDRLVRDGLTAEHLVEFVARSPLFIGDRLPLLRQAVEAHLAGDFAKSVHLLVPQIERALVNLPPLAGKPSNKAHHSGRGVMQFKSLNDVLDRDGWPVSGQAGENLRMYLLSVLAHPKGLNIRNDICHGLWPADAFTGTASKRVLHVLLVVSMLRRAAPSATTEAGTAAEPPRPGPQKSRRSPNLVRRKIPHDQHRQQQVHRPRPAARRGTRCGGLWPVPHGDAGPRVPADDHREWNEVPPAAGGVLL